MIARIGFRAISELLLSVLTTSCRRRSWIRLPMLCEASLVSVLRHFFWSLLPWSSNVVLLQVRSAHLVSSERLATLLHDVHLHHARDDC